MAEDRAALVVGATSLVGSHLLTRLLARPEYGKVTIWVRRDVPSQRPKLRQVVVDFERLQQYAVAMDAQDVFVTLGTTIKRAGSQQAFRHVDYDYPVQIASLAKQRRAQRF